MSKCNYCGKDIVDPLESFWRSGYEYCSIECADINDPYGNLDEIQNNQVERDFDKILQKKRRR